MEKQMFRCLLLKIVALAWLIIPAGFAYSDSGIVDLAGTWKVRLDPDDLGEREFWFKEVDGVDAQMPGIVTEAGLGTPLGLKPALTKKVFEHLHQKRSYIGAAWFSRKLQLDNADAFERAQLSIERVLWTSDVWVNGVRVGSQNSLSVEHRFDVGAQLKTGENVIAIRVDNRPHVDIGVLGHAYTQQTQTIWNGLLGDIELRSQPVFELSGFQVTPQLNSKGMVELQVQVTNHSKKTSTQDIAISLEALGQPGTAVSQVKSRKLKPGANSFKLKLSPGEVLPWSEFTPQLYRVRCELAGAERELTTGFRTFVGKRRSLQINSQPVFLRGTLDCCIFPKTGYPPTDAESWNRIFSTLKDHGINHVRFHSWCPPSAAFEMADKLGIYLQPELPNWTARMGQAAEVDEFFIQEGKRILKTYGHHPSFVLFSLGNELSGDYAFLDKMIVELRQSAPHLMFTSTSYSFSKRGQLPGPEDDFFISQKTRSGWVRGQGFLNDNRPGTATDYAAGLKAIKIPLVTHEVGQYCVYPNLAEIDKYDGNLRALNFEAIRDDLVAKGRQDEAALYTKYSGKLAALLYKEDIERALRTKGLSGIQLLGLQDFSGQSTATVGLLDAFWESKGILPAEQFRRFCSPVVPLMKSAKLTWNNTETLKAQIEVANFGPQQIDNATFDATITGPTGNVVHSQQFKVDVPLGNGIDVGEVSFPLGEVRSASKLKLEIRLAGTRVANDWEFWCYPTDDSIAEAAPAKDYKVMRKVNDEFESAVAAGETILLLPERGNIRDPLDGRFVPVFWSPLHFPNQPGALGSMIQSDHPAFENFPTDDHSNWQWWELLSKSTSVNATKLGPKFQPIMRFVDKYNRNELAACLWETRIGQAKVFVCTLDIESNPKTRTVARQLHRSLRAYLASEKFDPQFSCEMETFASLFQVAPTPLTKAAAQGNLASSVSPTPEYISGTVTSIDNSAEAAKDTKFVWEQQQTNLGFVVDRPVEKGMVYTAKFKMGQYGGAGYFAQPIQFSIKSRKNKNTAWKDAESLIVKDMILAPNNTPGEYGHYMLSLVADEHPELIGHKQMLLEVKELKPWTQGYLGSVEFNAQRQPDKGAPNIVFVVADDLGWTDLGCFGSKFYETPNCDRLAREGMRFTNAYAAGPVCSPTRVSILTGKNPARLNSTEYFGCPTPAQWAGAHNTRVLPAHITDHIDLGEVTLAEMLRSRGYKTFFAGKWHCGEEPYWPQYQGFQQNFGGWTRGGPYGGNKYFSPYGNPMLEDGPDGEHLPDRLASETINFIEANSDRPFFAFLSMYSVHTPLMTRADLKAKYEKKRQRLNLKTDWRQNDSVWGDKPANIRTTQDHAVYAGMVEAMDQSVGRVMATLDRLLLTENTIVIFVSDNGGLSTSFGKWVPTSCEPLRAGKGWLYEGGIRVPLMIRWPKAISAAMESDTPVITTDLFATLASITGSSPASESNDGEDLSRLWKGQKIPDRNLYWHYPHFGNQGGFPGAVVRSGDWKLVQNFETDQIELYNLKNDIGEVKNEAAKHEDVVKRLTASLKKWQDSVNATPVEERREPTGKAK